MSEQKSKRPAGDLLMRIGIVIAVLGVVSMIFGIVNTGAPTPLAWVILVVGVLAALAGYLKRVLAAVERR